MSRPEILLDQKSSEKSVDSGEYIIDPETIAKWTSTANPQEGKDELLVPVWECMRITWPTFLVAFK